VECIRVKAAGAKVAQPKPVPVPVENELDDPIPF
jgi:hypothetical protein